MEIQEALRTIGLTEKESAVYTALLQLGRASAYSISEKSGLKKPTTYVILDELIEKGLARKVPRLKKQLFVAISPEQAFAVAEEKLLVAKTMLPELLALTRGESKKVNTLYFEGVRGMKQLLEYRMKEMNGKELVGFYATDFNADPELVRFFKEDWGPGMAKRDITMRIIAPEHPSLKDYRDVDQKWGRTTKTVPYEQYSSEVAVDVIEDVVRIHDYKNQQGVILENEDVAKTVRQIFEMCWAKL